MKKLRLLALLLVATVPFAACGDDGTTEPETGSIQGTVVVEGSPLEGVSVAISGPESATATTNSNGEYSFSDVQTGSYNVEIAGGVPNDVTFESTAKSASVSGEQTATVDFSGDYIRTATISGQVTAQTEDGTANVSGITVNLSGTEERTTQTDQDGNFVFDGLRAGSYTVSIDAEGLDIEFDQTSQQVQVSVGGSAEVNFTGIQPRAAQVFIQRVTDDDGDHINPDDVEDRIFVDLAVEPGTETVSRVAIALNGTEVASQDLNVTSSSSSAAASAQPTVTLSVNTAAFDQQTLQVDYPNGEYELTASLETAEGSTAMAAQSQTLTFDNEDILAVEFVDGSGNTAVSEGVRWHGGASFQLNAQALLYSAQAQIDQIGVTCTTESGTGDLNLNGAGAGAEALTTAPFEYSAGQSDNVGVVEDDPPSVATDPDSDGNDGHTCAITSVLDPDGLELIDQFTNVNDLTNFFVDFTAPSGAAGNEIFVDVNANEALDAGEDPDGTTQHFSTGTFFIGSLTDGGVGGINLDFAADVASTTADPDLASVSQISDLSEREDIEYNVLVTVIEDALANQVDLSSVTVDPSGGDTGSGPAEDNASEGFGVDRTAPLLTDIFPEAGTLLVLNPDDDNSDGTSNNDVLFTANDPDLADGNAGSGVDVASVAAELSDGTPVTVATGSAPDYVIDANQAALSSDATYEITGTVPDLSNAANETEVVWDIIIDATAPGLALSDLPQSTSTTADSVRVSIGGTLTDTNGVDPDASNIEVFDSVDGTCNNGDDVVLTTSSPRQINRNDVSIGTSFDEEFWLVRDGFSGSKTYCFVVTGSDIAKNNTGAAEPNVTTQVTSNSISWN